MPETEPERAVARPDFFGRGAGVTAALTGSCSIFAGLLEACSAFSSFTALDLCRIRTRCE